MKIYVKVCKKNAINMHSYVKKMQKAVYMQKIFNTSKINAEISNLYVHICIYMQNKYAQICTKYVNMCNLYAKNMHKICIYIIICVNM